MQNRNFSRFLSADAAQDNGISAILGNSVINKMDTIVGSVFDVLHDVGIVILRPCYSRIDQGLNGNSLTSKTRSAPKLLASSWLRLEAVVTTLYPESLANWIAYCPTDELPP